MRNDSANRVFNRLNRWYTPGPLAPRLRVGLRLASGRPGSSFFRLPLQRSLPLILMAGGMLAVFCIPYFTFDLFAGTESDDLFDLVAMLFSLFWLTGWSVGVLLLLALLLVSAFGTETLQLRPGWLTVRLEVLRLGLGADFRADRISRLRWQPTTSDGHEWRGAHLEFEYAGQSVRVGSHLTEAQARQIARQVQMLVIEQAPVFPVADAPIRTATLTPAGAHSGASAPVEHARDRTPEPGLQATSTRVLLLANLIPLAGVFLADWRIGDIMLLFWAESAIIGFFNLLKMWVIGRWSALLLGPFFLGHFGAFMAGHLLFIYVLFLSGPDGSNPSIRDVAADFLLLWPALLGLMVSHAVSFQHNFIARQEYLGTSLRGQMGAPYRRVVIMHMTIIFGGFLTMVFDAPVLALVLLIGLKTLVDARAHIGEHRRQQAQARAAQKDGAAAE